MTLGPLFRREFLAPRRSRQIFQDRMVWAILMGGASLLFYALVFEDLGLNPRMVALSGEVRRLGLGRCIFVTTFVLEVTFLILLVPDGVGVAVAEERERDTFDGLILTGLTALEIVATKAVARGLAASRVVLVGLPLLVGSAELAGLLPELLLGLVVLASTTLFAASVSILAAVRPAPVARAKGRAYVAVLGWLLVPPLLTLVPVPGGSIWGEVLAEAKRAAGLAAPLSPVALATDPGWFYRSTAPSLEARVVLLVALQGAVGLGALLLAARRLDPRDRPAGRGDPARGGRARCGDDPIFWREYELPASVGARPSLLALASYFLMLVTGLVRNTLAIFGALVAVAIPVAILATTIYLGTAALREAWVSPPPGDAGPAFVARDRFNGLVRFFVGTVLIVPILGLPTSLIARIASERDRKTWDDFLMTPLDGATILRSKARVALRGLARPAGWAAMVVAVAVASGAAMPLGAVLAAVDLALIAVATTALGLSWGVRPFPQAAITNRTLLASLVLVVAHGPLLIVLGMSPREFAAARARSPLFLPGLILAGLVVATATAVVARLAWRRTLARFDEWVGRPTRPD